MAGEWQRFSTLQPPFSIDFPSDWTLHQDGDAFELEAPVDDLAVTLNRFSSPDGDISPASIQVVLDAFAEKRVVRAAPGWFSAEEWNGVEAEFGPSPTEEKGSHWLFRAVCRGNRAYVMTATGPREDVERGRHVCMQIMNSLKLREE